MNPEQVVREKYHQLHENLNEQQKRLLAATEALSYGYGGVSIVHRATGLSRPTINFGIQEIKQGSALKSENRIRRVGGGRKHVETEYPHLSIILPYNQKLESTTFNEL